MTKMAVLWLLPHEQEGDEDYRIIARTDFKLHASQIRKHSSRIIVL
jgi:hypothetical protein